MKSRRRGGELFGLSFLDVICCGFGAMVLLVLLSKTDVVGGAVDAVADLLGDVIAEQKRNAANEQQRVRLAAQTRTLEDELKNEIARASDADLAAMKKLIADRRAQVKTLQAEINATARQSPRARATTDEVVKVGGIPVDSDHIIFIVDTSGSMQTMWQRVVREMKNVLDIHPKVKGFQIMNDNGVYLIKAYARKWMPDTPSRRKSVLAAMRNWTSFSNSSPVEGLEVALRAYAKRTDKLAIYIFGDDYSGGSYDPVLDTLAELNRDRASGKPIVRIHAIGFLPANHAADRFATLMREVTRRNRGAFVGLGFEDKTSIVNLKRGNAN